MRARVIALALVVVLAGTGCVSTPKDRSLISLRKANLSLVFKDPALVTPVPPQIIQQFVPAAPDVARMPGIPTRLADASPLEVCPDPPDDAPIAEPAHLAVRTPRPGTYLRYNEGTITVTSGTVELKLPYPFITKVEVGNVRVVESPGVAGSPLGAGTWTHFEVLETLVPGFTELVEYRYNLERIELVRRESTNDNGTSVFVPQPPISVFELASPGTTWRGVGVDTEAERARAVSGTVGAPERVELCGAAVEAVPGTVDVSDARLGDGAALDGTIEPLVQHWLPQYGALVARQDLHSSELVQTEQGAVRITYDVVSRLMSVEPMA